MQKGKIILIDYVGQSNELGQPVGHPVKALKEAVELLAQSKKVELIIPQNYEQRFSNYDIKFLLKHYCRINIKSFYNRAACFLGKISNLTRIFKTSADSILWFINPDFLLFVFLFFSPFKIKKAGKIVLSLYMEGFDHSNKWRGKIKNYFFKRTIGKVDLVMKNSEKITVSDKEIFYPDYIYREENYKQYRGKKSDSIVCVGLMNQARDLVTLVKVYRQSNIQLKLKMAGYFPDKNLYKKILKYANEDKRIEILDEYLTQEEYYKNIAGAKFSILPYKKANYRKRTSGILLESIFLDTTVIAPGFLLDFTDLPGIGYEKLDDIEAILTALDDKKLKEIKGKMREVRVNFGYEKVREKIYKAFESRIS